MDDLLELQNHLKEKYNIDVYINKSRKYDLLEYIDKVEVVYVILLLIIVFICIIYFIYKYLSKKYKAYKKIFLYLFIVPISIVLIYLLIKYLYMVYLYYNNTRIHNHINNMEKVNYNDIEFKTGDILQDTVNWNYKYNLLLFFINVIYFHNIFIIKFKDKNYVLHYIRNNFAYPENIISFKSTNNIEIFLLDDYLKDNNYSSKYYRLFKINNEISNDSIFKFLQSLNKDKLQFTVFPCFKDCNINNFNCVSFILKLLNFTSVIPNLNFSNLTPNDFIYLPQLSNYVYNEPCIMVYNNV